MDLLTSILLYGSLVVVNLTLSKFIAKGLEEGKGVRILLVIPLTFLTLAVVYYREEHLSQKKKPVQYEQVTETFYKQIK